MFRQILFKGEMVRTDRTFECHAEIDAETAYGALRDVVLWLRAILFSEAASELTLYSEGARREATEGAEGAEGIEGVRWCDSRAATLDLTLEAGDPEDTLAVRGAWPFMRCFGKAGDDVLSSLSAPKKLVLRVLSCCSKGGVTAAVVEGLVDSPEGESPGSGEELTLRGFALGL